ncbi:MAG: hypothetical protein H6620_09805 [Halobacteriovoraceae bacterium]|nr:hypothetical protein [Halobacteriovoraceae bacterium]
MDVYDSTSNNQTELYSFGLEAINHAENNTKSLAAYDQVAERIITTFERSEESTVEKIEALCKILIHLQGNKHAFSCKERIFNYIETLYGRVIDPEKQLLDKLIFIDNQYSHNPYYKTISEKIQRQHPQAGVAVKTLEAKTHAKRIFDSIPISLTITPNDTIKILYDSINNLNTNDPLIRNIILDEVVKKVISIYFNSNQEEKAAIRNSASQLHANELINKTNDLIKKIGKFEEIANRSNVKYMAVGSLLDTFNGNALATNGMVGPALTLIIGGIALMHWSGESNHESGGWAFIGTGIGFLFFMAVITYCRGAYQSGDAKRELQIIRNHHSLP